jgi:hypothetical protein
MLTDSQNASDTVVNSLRLPIHVTPKMYAKSTIRLGESETLQLKAQCTRDLSSTDCKKCRTYQFYCGASKLLCWKK